MFRYIRQLVSKKRKRFIKDGFDLDLSYITNRIIAMSYPAENLEAIFRNPYWQVQSFLDKKHPNRYKVYNLCSEASYDPSYFHGRIETMPFEDHHCPTLSLIKRFCESAHAWLHDHPENTVVVHCRAGKGRTGLMVCCYLVFLGMGAEKALEFYGQKRTHDCKGVTICSQMRYVKYWERMLRWMNAPPLSPNLIQLPKPKPKTIQRLRLYDAGVLGLVNFQISELPEGRNEGRDYLPPKEKARGQCTARKKNFEKICLRYFLCKDRGIVDSESFISMRDAYNPADYTYDLEGLSRSNECCDVFGYSDENDSFGNSKWIVQMDTERPRPSLDHYFENPVQVCGDVWLRFYDRGCSRLFYVIFNTAFIKNGILSLKKDEVDKRSGKWNKMCGPDFSIEILFGNSEPSDNLMESHQFHVHDGDGNDDSY